MFNIFIYLLSDGVQHFYILTHAVVDFSSRICRQNNTHKVKVFQEGSFLPTDYFPQSIQINSIEFPFDVLIVKIKNVDQTYKIVL